MRTGVHSSSVDAGPLINFATRQCLSREFGFGGDRLQNLDLVTQQGTIGYLLVFFFFYFFKFTRLPDERVLLAASYLVSLSENVVMFPF